MSTVHMANEKCKWEGLNQNREGPTQKKKKKNEKNFVKTGKVVYPYAYTCTSGFIIM